MVWQHIEASCEQDVGLFLPQFLVDPLHCLPILGVLFADASEPKTVGARGEVLQGNTSLNTKILNSRRRTNHLQVMVPQQREEDLDKLDLVGQQ